MSTPTTPTTTAARPTAPSLARVLLALLLSLALVAVAGIAAPTEAAAATSSNVRELQQRLKDLGYPVGTVDGIDGPQTRRGLCAWRRLEGRTAHRGPVTSSELTAVRRTPRLPAASAGRGVTADRTCQTVYYRESGRWQRVLIASTGAGGTLPKQGSYTIQRTRAGWHTSTKYPAPQPNMYNTLYFDGAIAIHGARDVPTYPASKGCVRVTPKGADYLFARMKVGDPVKVIGSY